MDPRIARLDEVIRRAAGVTVTAAADGTTHTVFPVAIPPVEGEALSRWVARERAAASIEVGLGYGMSALFILRGLLAGGSPAPRHLAMDPHQVSGFSGIALQLVVEAGLRDLVEFYPEPSEIVLPRLVGEARRFDLAFVDGNHRFDAVFVDLMFLGRLVRGGGVIFLDDHQLPAIRKAVAFCTNDLGWAVEEEGSADERHDWVVLRTPATPRERRFDDFVDF